MPDDDKIALRFGNYEVFSRPDGQADELGRGGFGCTYRARHRFLRKVVALKVISEQLARNEDAKRRFLREAREHSALEHPGIARLTDFGEAEGTFFYAMEHCPDGDLKEYVTRRGPLPPVEALRLVRQTAEALQFAHSHGIMHRDVKPSNLLLVHEGDGLPLVKLIDFGLVKHLAKANADETRDHVSGSLWSATFASPEQILEQPLDERTDIFSLGMTAWFLVAGSGPVEGTQMEIIQERLSPEGYESRLPSCLTGERRRVVARMLEKDASRRYRNCTELLADLTKAIEQPDSPLKKSIPVAPVRPLARMVDRFSLKAVGSDSQGEIFTGFDREQRMEVRVTRLHTEHPPAVIKEMQARVRQLTGAPLPGVAPVLEMKEFAEGWALVEKDELGVLVADVLRRCGPVALSALAPFLHEAAGAIDAAVAAGCHPLPLESGIMEGVSGSGPVNWPFARMRIRVRLAAPPPGWTPDSDLTAPPLVASTLQSFAGFVYFAVGGRRVPDKALFASSAFIPIPGLGSDANETLASCLSGNRKHPDCRTLLQALVEDERLSPACIHHRKQQGPTSGKAASDPLPKAAEETAAPKEPSREAILLTPAILSRPAAPRAKPRHTALKSLLFTALVLGAFGFGGWYWKVHHTHQGNPPRGIQPVATDSPKKTEATTNVKVPAEATDSDKRKETAALAEKQRIEAARKALEEVTTADPITFLPPSVDRKIFNGKDLKGWKGQPDFWSVKEGVISAQTTKEKPLKEATCLIWDGEVKDFGLRLKYRIVNPNGKADGFANSGVLYRGKATKSEFTFLKAYRMDFGEDLSRSGVLFEEKGRGLLARQGLKVVLHDRHIPGKPDLEVTGTLRKAEEIQAPIRPSNWNECVIMAKGGHLQHFINGKLVVDVTDEVPDRARSGEIALQIQPGPPVAMEFKDIVLTTER